MLMLLLLLLFLLTFSNIGSSAVVDSNTTITSSRFIQDSQTISSTDDAFKLGFFSPANTTNRYVGIWYLTQSDVVWVANRDKPLQHSSSGGGVITISPDNRNLVVLNGDNQVIWSSNVSTSSMTPNSTTTAQLLNTGNLVLLDDTTGKKIWESFKQPSDTFLPSMIISNNQITGEKIKTTSWKSPSDPAIGNFSGSLDRLSAPEIFVWKQTRPYWRSGPWNGQVFIGFPGKPVYTTAYLNGFSISREDNGTVDITYTLPNTSFFGTIAVTSQGKLVYTAWINRYKVGKKVFQEGNCDIYGFCGPNGSCDLKNSPICTCLRGFEPKSVGEWNRQNWTGGCVRREALQCERLNSGSSSSSSSEAASADKEDGFMKLQLTKVPDFANQSYLSADACRTECLSNCSCTAYAFDNGIGCLTYTGRLIDIVRFSTAGIDVYIRQAYSELDSATTDIHKKKKRNVTGIIIAIVLVGAFILATSTYFLWSWTFTKRSARRKAKQGSMVLRTGETHQENPMGAGGQIGDAKQAKIEDLPLFDFRDVSVATNDFGLANKIGQGGFGLVYKGELADGQEVAVKRLSKASGQGVEEFMNEVVVISKLQHRNLVRLLGCCIEGDEKMLVYEYMPNNSLDFYLFDPFRKKVLDWQKRLNIIEGISRGLLYLHRDSRLRIIHRDLKPSNILLDGQLNPKISDFGMAKIFGGTESEGNTRRIAGTYGYMSPEYAMEGLFSEKSDVFSFGVLLLEIISGRKNTSFYNQEQSMSLLGYAWKLWNEERIVSLIDEEICSTPENVNKILRCIHIGILCAQEFAKDRPSMATVVSMLNSEIVNFPRPRQPAFIERQNEEQRGESSQQSRHSNNSNTINSLTITRLQGR